ncbi:hypothetical protein D9M69_416050 [compost metagenome]
MACWVSFRSRRRFISASTSAPSAPMPPPSVGVATPMKMVPSTRKISASGGISTKVTFSAMCDSRFSLSALLMTATTKANRIAAPTAITRRSSSGASGLYSLSTATPTATDSAVSTSTDAAPLLPLGSRKVRASIGSAGAADGLISETSST